MRTQKRPLTRAEKWFGTLTIAGIAALAVWGWIDSRPLPPRLDLPRAYVRAMRLSPNQEFLAVGSENSNGNGIYSNTVTVWNARTLKVEIPFHTSQRLMDFCLSDDASQIGTLGGKTTFEWRDRATQKLLWSFAPPKPYLTFWRVLFLKKKSLIWLSASKISGKTRNFLLSARKGTLVHQWDDDDWGYFRVAVSSDETIAARPQTKRDLSGQIKSSTLVLQKVDNGQILRRFKVAPSSVSPLFSPDARSLFLLTSPDALIPDVYNNVVRCLDSRTGQQIWSFDALHVASDINAWRRYQISKQTGTTENEPYDAVAFLAIAISPDGATVAVMRAIDSMIYLLDARTGQQRRTLTLPLGKAEMGSFDSPTPLLFAPDGKHLFAHTNDSIFAWKLD